MGTLFSASWHRQKAQLFWNRRITSHTCHHSIYLYTAADMVSDASAVDWLISKRQTMIPSFKVQIHRWNDSGHCRLHRDHAEQYQTIIDQALQDALQRVNPSKTL